MWSAEGAEGRGSSHERYTPSLLARDPSMTPTVTTTAGIHHTGHACKPHGACMVDTAAFTLP